jgi:hypothetical protein
VISLVLEHGMNPALIPLNMHTTIHVPCMFPYVCHRVCTLQAASRNSQTLTSVMAADNCGLKVNHGMCMTLVKVLHQRNKSRILFEKREANQYRETMSDMNHAKACQGHKAKARSEILEIYRATCKSCNDLFKHYHLQHLCH